MTQERFVIGGERDSAEHVRDIGRQHGLTGAP